MTREKKIAQNADTIYLLNKGKILASGTDKELKKENEYYKNLEKQNGKKKTKSNIYIIRKVKCPNGTKKDT